MKPKVIGLLAIVTIAACVLWTGVALDAAAQPWSTRAEDRPTSEGAAFDDLLGHYHPPVERAAGIAPPALAAGILPQGYADFSYLVFQSARNGHDWEIYTARGDGSDQRNVTNHPESDIHPRLNRGATRIVFASKRYGNYDIFTMDLDGTGLTRITDAVQDDVSPAWSPDGSRIVFQSYRDGQPEIYTMNADGSNQTRITIHDDYDAQPTWSPDGSEIAFVRREGGRNRIWVMSAGGANLRQVSFYPSSENPAWSAQGIGYDADSGGDGWQELWVIGRSLPFYSAAQADTDVWMGSWSPEGRYIAHTTVSWVLEGDSWYWTTAYLDAHDSSGNGIRLSTSGLDWNPDWQSTDILIPTSSMTSLPAQSPHTFTIKWTAADAGSSGLAGVNVQYRRATESDWSTVQYAAGSGSAEVRGTAGETYLFRARAEDNAGNFEPWPPLYDAVTTIETLPPQTSIDPLPAFTRGNRIDVTFGGFDPGGSGINCYRPQYRYVGGPGWSDMDVYNPCRTYLSAGLTDATQGRTYEFRVAGYDNAGTWEAWPPGDSADARTTLYRWGAAGRVLDNGGAPIRGASVNTTPAALLPTVSDAAGSFAAYVGAEDLAYGLQLSKGGYGTLPVTLFADGADDARLDIVLPPTDDVIRNGSFEGAALNPDWQAAGTAPVALISTGRHTGAQSVRLGEVATAFLPPVQVSEGASASEGLQMVRDRLGGLHLAWPALNNGNRDIFYAYQAPHAAAFGAPTMIATPLDSREPALAAGPDGSVHLAWLETQSGQTYVANVTYATALPGGSWSTPVQLTSGIPRYDVRIAVDTAGRVHVAWRDGEFPFTIHRTWRDSSGWRTAQLMSNPAQMATEPRLVAGVNGEVHLAWSDDVGTWYACQDADGTWSSPKSIMERTGANLVADDAGQVHAVSLGAGLRYTRGTCRGPWTPVTYPGTADWAPNASLAVDPSGRAHVTWNDGAGSTNALRYAHTMITGWSTPEDILRTHAIYANYSLVGADGSGTAHLVWRAQESPGFNIYYQRRTRAEPWTTRQKISVGVRSVGGSALAVEENGTVHAAWLEGTADAARDVYYSRSAPAAASGDTTLSQAITVPAAGNPGLSFFYQAGGLGAGGGSLRVAVQGAGDATTLVEINSPSADWTHRWLDLEPWAGQPVTIHFRLGQVAGQPPPWVILDDVSVGSTHADTWVTLPDRDTAPGQQVRLPLAYGNHGAVAAPNARIALELPAGLTFISADPPPTATAPSTAWDVGDLSTGEDGVIELVLEVGPDAIRTLTVRATITTDTGEIEQANNLAEGSLLVAYTTRLPAAQR